VGKDEGKTGPNAKQRKGAKEYRDAQTGGERRAPSKKRTQRNRKVTEHRGAGGQQNCCERARPTTSAARLFAASDGSPT
jgi:hypothetical protein